MENLIELKDFIDLLQMLLTTIPNGAKESMTINGSKVTLSKDGSDIKIEMESSNEDTDLEETFDDSYIREIVSDYKKSIEELDDCLFVSVLEEIGKAIDINRFNNLLDKDSFTEEEADEVKAIIIYSSHIIRKFLQDKIQDLLELYEKF